MARETKRETKKETPKVRKALRRLMLVALAVGLATGVSLYLVHRYLMQNSQFVLSRDRRDALTIDGLHYGSRYKVQHVFAEDTDHSVFSVPLEARRRRLLALDWVQDAAVSRIWPDRLAVRIRERRPVAFVNVESTVMLIDDQGRLLEPPPQSAFSFPVLSGVRAEDSQDRRMEAVRALLDVEEALGAAAMKDISEVNAADPANIRVVAQLNGQVVDLTLGEDDFGSRYRNFVAHYPEIHKRSPEMRVFDLRVDDRIMAR